MKLSIGTILVIVLVAAGLLAWTAHYTVPSDRPEFAEFPVQCGIDSLSVSPDRFVAVKQRVAAAESGI